MLKQILLRYTENQLVMAGVFDKKNPLMFWIRGM